MKHYLAVVGMAAFMLLIPWLGLKDFYSRGEAREALVAQRMVLTGNYVLPQSYDGAVPSKPPVLHWLIAAGSKLFGGDVNEFSARFPSAAASVLFLLYFGWFLRDRIAIPWLPPFMLLTTIEWFRCSADARVDCLLSVFIGAGLLGLYRWHERALSGYPWAAVVLLGLAGLTKGPIGIALPLGIFGLFLLAERTPVIRIARALFLAGFPALVIGLAWYFAAFIQGGDAFWRRFFYENIARLTSSMDDEPHRHGILYLYGVLLAFFLPWTIFAVTGLWAKRSELTKAAAARFWKNGPLVRFCIIWAAVVILFFSIPSSKRSTYLLPAYPALSILLGFLVISAPRAAERTARILGSTLASLGAILIIASFLPSVQRSIGMIEVPFASVMSLCILCMADFAILSNKKAGLEQALVSCIASLYAVYLAVQVSLAPSIANYVSYRPFARTTEATVAGADRLYSYLDSFYGFSFYLKKPFYSIPSSGDAPVPEGYVYLFERNRKALEARLSREQILTHVSTSERGVVNKRSFVELARIERR